MKPLAPFRPADWLALLLVLAGAVGARVGYVLLTTAEGEGVPLWQVQGEGPTRGGRTEFTALVEELRAEGRFAARAPLSDDVESTAHVSPGYPWLAALLIRLGNDALLRWFQCALGAGAAALLFLFARRVFRSLAAATLAGLLVALHPFGIVNVAERADGVVASFLVAAALFLGARGSQTGGPFTSLLYGATLAGMALVRAPFLPFALAGLVWFLVACRGLRQGWLPALLAFLGLANGLAPWLVRNVKEFNEPLPVVSSTWLHLYVGNNARTTGGPLDEAELRASLPADRLSALLREKNQARRYDMLADEVRRDPGAFFERRLQTGAAFILGDTWLRERRLALGRPRDDGLAAPPWLDDAVPAALAASLLLMAALGLWGWRRSLAWGGAAGLLTLAAVLLPLPYLLGHAGSLAGPRLPVDGVWLTYAALALSGIRAPGPGAAEKDPEAT